MFKDTVGFRIKAFRKQRGLTQEELAIKSGVSVMSIRRYESEERTPKFATMEKIASALQIDVENVLFSLEELLEAQHGLEKAHKAMCEKELMQYFDLLNLKGQRIAVERVCELSKIDEYTKEYPEVDEVDMDEDTEDR